MKSKIVRFLAVASAALVYVGVASAQNAGTVTNHAIPVGKGPGVQGLGSIPSVTAGLALVGNGPSADPSYQDLTRLGAVTQGSWLATIIGPTYGGTGVNNGARTLTLGATILLPSITQGDILFGATTGVVQTIGKSPTATRYIANTGSSNNPVWDQINLANGVTGLLSAGNGGLGVTNPSALTHKASPTTSDLLIIGDAAASNAYKYSTIAEAVGAVASGVTSINGNTGAFTLGVGLKNVGNDLQTEEIAPYMLTNSTAVIDQINESGLSGNSPYASLSTAENWAVDGYRIYCAGGTPGAFTLSRRFDVFPNGFNAVVAATVSTANAAPTAGDNCHTERWITPSLAAPLKWGTSEAKQITYSRYQACSNNGSYAVTFLPADNSTTFVGSMVYSGSGAFQRLSITVPGDTATNSAYQTAGVKIVDDYGFGTNFQLSSPSTVWGAGFKATFVGAEQLIKRASGAVCFWTGEQIDFGPKMLSYRGISPAQELARSQLFKCKTAPQGTPMVANKGMIIAGPLQYSAPATGVTGTGLVTFTCPVQMSTMDYPASIGANPQKIIPKVNFISPGTGTSGFVGTAKFWNPAAAAGAGADSGLASINYSAVSSQSVSVYNSQIAGDNIGQILGIGAWLGSCPGNTGTGTGCTN